MLSVLTYHPTIPPSTQTAESHFLPRTSEQLLRFALCSFLVYTLTYHYLPQVIIHLLIIHL